MPSSSSVFFGRMTPISCVDAGLVLHLDQRQAMAVGRHQRQALRLQHELRAVEEIPRVLAGDRELRLGDHLAARAARGSVARAFPLTSGSVGKSSRGSVCIRESNRSAATLTPFLSSSIRTSVSGSALTISYSFFAGSVSDPPLATDAVTAAAQRDFEVGREHPHLVALGFDQHVRENRNRVLPLDDALEKLQFSQKLILPDNEFHRRVVTSSGAVCPR